MMSSERPTVLSKWILGGFFVIFLSKSSEATVETTEPINAGISSGINWGPKARDCADIQGQEYTESGVYTVYVGPRWKPVQVYCDLDNNGGGWLVFQRREDGFENFLRGWKDYAEGFGDLYGEFWLGNHVLHQLTNQENYTLRVDMEDFTNETRYAEYTTFKVGAPFRKYILEIGGFTGDAGDAMAAHSGHPFTTHDQDNDSYSKNCAQTFKGAWWYYNCHSSNLNGFYYGGFHTSYADGINWRTWPSYADYSLKFTQLKIRPTNFAVENN